MAVRLDGNTLISGENGGIPARLLPDGSLEAAKLADGAVTTAKLGADAVTGAKIADDAVDSEHIATGAIDTEHIGSAQVTAAKIGSGAATDGYVLTADGAGAAAWEAVSSVGGNTVPFFIGATGMPGALVDADAVPGTDNGQLQFTAAQLEQVGLFVRITAQVDLVGDISAPDTGTLNLVDSLGTSITTASGTLSADNEKGAYRTVTMVIEFAVRSVSAGVSVSIEYTQKCYGTVAGTGLTCDVVSNYGTISTDSAAKMLLCPKLTTSSGTFSSGSEGLIVTSLVAEGFPPVAGA